MNIAENIDSILLEKKWSRRKLAQEAGIPPSTLQSAMERNKDYSIVTLQKIAVALNVPIGQLIHIPTKEELHSMIKESNVENRPYEGFAGLNKKQREELINSGQATINHSNGKIMWKTLELIQREKLLSAFHTMNDAGQQKAISQVQDLAKIPEYQKEENANAPEKDNS